MQMKTSVILFIIFCSFIILKADNIQKNRILLLVDNLAIKQTHSKFIQNLINDGYQVSINWINSPYNKIKEFNEYLYDHIIVFCTSEINPLQVRPKNLVEFFDNGGNLIIAADIDTSLQFRQMFNDLGVEIDPIGTQVLDHFNNAGDSTIISTNNFVQNDIFTEKNQKSILYRGVSLSLTIYENFQVYGLLKGSDYSYSYNHDPPSKVYNVGNQMILVAALQGRNNARAILTGSLDMFSNELYEKSLGANEKYINNLSKWAFNLNGLLRIGQVFHHKIGESIQPNEYKIMDDIKYSIEIEKFDYKNQKWTPYIADDLLLEFVMLDPYIRMPLQKDNSTKQNSKYIAEFKVPDKWGVFQFIVKYQKPGYSFLNSATKIPVRPLKHNEFERYLYLASPYYIGVFGSLFCFVVFFLYFLYDSSKISKSNIQ